MSKGIKLIPKDEHLLPMRGYWGIWKTYKRVYFTCPDCGNSFCLSNHQIDDYGKVFPSVVCPHEGCHFHQYITLDKWEPYV